MWHHKWTILSRKVTISITFYWIKSSSVWSFTFRNSIESMHYTISSKNRIFYCLSGFRFRFWCSHEIHVSTIRRNTSPTLDVKNAVELCSAFVFVSVERNHWNVIQSEQLKTTVKWLVRLRVKKTIFNVSYKEVLVWMDINSTAMSFGSLKLNIPNLLFF